MTQQISPFLEGKYGWNYGEGGWNVGADENWLKYGYLLDNNVNGVVSALPALVNGEAYFLTTDNRFYFAVGGNWYSSPCPKWFIFKIKDSGDFWWYDGVSAVAISNPQQLSDAITTIQSSIGSLGTAAYVNIEDLATQAELDIASAQAAAYTDTLRSDLSADAGSSLVGFKQAGVGAVPRTMLGKARESVSFKDFGAVGDGVTDDTAAIQAALSYAASSGSSIVDNGGKYRISSQINVSASSKGLSISCTGSKMSRLIWDAGSSGGISVTIDVWPAPVLFKGLSIESVGAIPSPAISVQYSSYSSSNLSWQGAIFDSISIGQSIESQSAGGFSKGVQLTNCPQPVFTNCVIRGTSDVSYTTSGIEFNGQCTAPHILGCRIFFCDTAIRVSGVTEEPRVLQCALVANNYGIYLDTDDLRPGLGVRGCHISSYKRNIYARARAQAQITGNLFYRRDGAVADFVDIELGNYLTYLSQDWTITGNAFEAGGLVSSSVAVKLAGPGHVVADNIIRSRSVGVWLPSDTSVSISSVCNNVYDASVITGIKNDITETDNATSRNRISSWRSIGATYDRVKLTSSQSIASGAATVLPWSADVSNEASYSSGSPSVLTVPSWCTRVRLTANIVWDANSAGYRKSRFLKNGAAFLGGSSSVSTPPAGATCEQHIVTGPIQVVGGDTFSVEVTQTSGGNINVAASSYSWFCIEFLA